MPNKAILAKGQGLETRKDAEDSRYHGLEETLIYVKVDQG